MIGLLSIGLGGAAATAFAAVFAGSVFALIVGAVSAVAFWRQRGRRKTLAPTPPGPAPVTLGERPPD